MPFVIGMTFLQVLIVIWWTHAGSQSQSTGGPERQGCEGALPAVRSGSQVLPKIEKSIIPAADALRS